MGGETVVGKALGYAPPSALARAAVSLLLLIGFYLLLLGFAAGLFVLPILAILALQKLNFYLIALVGICWVPAVLLLVSAFTTRRPPFVPPKRRLLRTEAPALFAAVDELANRAGTAPPTEIYLEPTPNLGVIEIGSVRSPRRVMIVGAPLLCWLSIDELRAGIAHELGHFFGGDTRLTTFNVQTHALFSSVLNTVERDAFREGTQHYAIEAGFVVAQALGGVLVKGYSRLYWGLTRPSSRRQELAADALSAALVSAPVAARALEEVMLRSALYFRYLQDEVGFVMRVMRRGAMPSDLVSGFERWRERVLTTDEGKGFVQAVRSAPTEAFDTHPALLDRLQALGSHPAGDERGDDRPATALLAEPRVFEAWLVEATREHMLAAAVEGGIPINGVVRDLPWARIAAEVQAPAAQEGARKLAERLHPILPEATTLSSMFVAVWHRVQNAPDPSLVLQVAPELGHLPPHVFREQAQLVCRDVLEALLQGALLERGAVAQESLGTTALLLQLGDEHIDTSALVRLLVRDPSAGRAALDDWAERLHAA